MINMYFHGGSANHGCEAIVRGTRKIVSEQCTLYTFDEQSDKKYGIHEIVSLQNDVKTKHLSTFKSLLSSIYFKLFKSEYLHYKYSHDLFFSLVKRNNVYLSIGGDNYCYAGNEIIGYYNKAIHANGGKTVLWGCSVEPSIFNDKRIVEDMKRYNLITVRETLSQEGLFNAGIKDNVFLCPDPAFQLDKVELPLPSNFVEGNTVGINVSPLIMSCESNEGITRENYIQLLDYIINNTDMNIALIPHVVWEDNDDRKPLQELYDLYKHTHRVCLIEDHNCMELKGYISRCRFFVGARTHATIAAYSTCVPTLVVGYSIKAKGIAKDIFGTYDNYVLPVQSLKEKDDLTKAFKWMQDNESNIKNHLNTLIPGYKERALEAGEKIKELVR